MTKRNPLPPYSYVRQLFDYEPATGILRWKVKRAQMNIGDAAGTLRTGPKGGHLQVSIDCKIYRVHCIIWLWMTGVEPTKEIDHEDLVGSNNRWDNLREATHSQNMSNTGISRRNTTGFKGVFWYKAYGKWAAQIWRNKKAYFLGYYDTPEEASAAYEAKAKELSGEFARIK